MPWRSNKSMCMLRDCSDACWNSPSSIGCIRLNSLSMGWFAQTWAIGVAGFVVYAFSTPRTHRWLFVSFLIPIPKGIAQFFQWVGIVNGHDGWALRIDGRVKRHRQIKLHTVIGHFDNHLGNANRGNCNPLHGHAWAFLRSNLSMAVITFLIVERRLAHAHEHNVGERPIEEQFTLFANGNHLDHKFHRHSGCACVWGRAVAQNLQAKLQLHLRGHACCDTRFGWNKHRLTINPSESSTAFLMVPSALRCILSTFDGVHGKMRFQQIAREQR